MTETRIDLPSGCMGVDPPSVRGPTAAGIDVRPGSYDVLIAEVVTSPMTNMSVVRLVFAGKVRDEADALFVMRQYKTRFAVIDTRPETTLAKRLQMSAREYGIKVWRAEYNTAPSAIECQENHNEMTLKLDRTMSLDSVHYAFSTGLSVAIPQNFREITRGQFLKEMMASSRTPSKWMGKDCYVWDHQGDDHAFHAFNYLLTAVRKSNLLAFGGDATMGADLGNVSSSLSKNIKVIDTGHKDPEKRFEIDIDWDKLMAEDDEQSAFIIHEA